MFKRSVLFPQLRVSSLKRQVQCMSSFDTMFVLIVGSACFLCVHFTCTISVLIYFCCSNNRFPTNRWYLVRRRAGAVDRRIFFMHKQLLTNLDVLLKKIQNIAIFDYARIYLAGGQWGRSFRKILGTGREWKAYHQAPDRGDRQRIQSRVRGNTSGTHTEAWVGRPYAVDRGVEK